MKKNAKQKTRWQKLPLAIKVALIGGAFTTIVACLTMVGTFIFGIFTDNFVEVMPNAYLHKIDTVHYRANYFPTLPCIDGKIWAIPEEDETFDLIQQGSTFNYMTYDEFHKIYYSVAPTISFLKLSADLSSTEQVQLEDISLEISFKPNQSRVLFLVLGNTCAGGGVGPPQDISFNPVIEYGQRITPTDQSVSLTVFDKNEIEPQIYNVSNSPQDISIVLNALEPGWYDIKVVAKYAYHSKEIKVPSNEIIRMYVPEAGSNPPVYLIPMGIEEKTILLSDSIDLSSQIIYYQQHSVYMSVEEEDRFGKFVRIQNMGVEQNLEGWKLEYVNRNLERKMFVFPHHILPEWDVVRVGNMGSLITDQFDFYVDSSSLGNDFNVFLLDPMDNWVP
ncbi:MAG: hypothetical protein ACOYZ6_07290 [Chloroflexota bacterium]